MFVLVAALIAVGLAIGYLLTGGQTGTTHSITTDESSSPVPCNSPIPEDTMPSLANESGVNNSHMLANGSMRSLAFIMRPRSTATLCITIPLRQGNVTVKDLEASALVVNATRDTQGGGLGYSYSYSKASDITFASDAGSKDLTSFESAPGSISILYTITSNDATGYYSFGYPGECGLIPFAVASDPRTVTSADFPGFFLSSTCPLFPPFSGWSQMTGFNGMTTVWLTG